MLQKAESDGSLKLDGEEADPCRNRLIETIISIIAKDTPTDQVKNELEYLTNIYKCTRRLGELLSSFVCRFKRCVAQYTVRTGLLKESTDRQVGMLLIQSTHLSTDTMTSVTSQISSVNATDKAPKLEVPLNAQKQILQIVEQCAHEHHASELDASSKAIKLLQNMVASKESRCGASFQLKETAEIVEQMRLDNDGNANNISKLLSK